VIPAGLHRTRKEITSRAIQSRPLDEHLGDRDEAVHLTEEI